MSKLPEQPPPYAQAPAAGFYPSVQGHTGNTPQQINPNVNVTVVVPPRCGPDPQTMVCPSCRATICTSVKYEPTTKTHLAALLLLLFGCWLCCCIPYCVDSCQNGNHYCPNCGSFIGVYKP